MVSWSPNHDWQREQSTGEQIYQRCPTRWWLAASVLLLNASNYAHWISFASIKSRAAEYYGVRSNDVQLVLSASYAVGVPTSLVAVAITDKFGLKHTLRWGGLLTFVGSLLCLLSSIQLSFTLLLVGQIMTGVGCPLVACLSTKVSQTWFASDERLHVTSVLALSSPIGMIVGQLLSPILRWQMCLLQFVYCLPSAFGLLIVLIKIKRDKPKFPPSPSEALRSNESISIMKVVTNLNFLILTTSLGGVMGFISTVQMKSESWLKNYTNFFSGLCAALIFIGGIVGSFIIPAIVQLSVCRMKIFLLPLGLTIALLGIVVCSEESYFIEVLIVYFAFGFCSIGLYPSLLELAVETTFPLDETLATSALFVSSALQTLLQVHLDDLVHLFYRIHQQKMYVSLLTIYSICLVLFAYLGFHVRMRRSVHDSNQSILLSVLSHNVVY